MRAPLRSTTVTALLVTMIAFAAPAAAQAKAVTGGEITINQGAAGVTLGMPRSEVVGLLGRPFYENANGYMEYGRGASMFDIYRTSGSRRSGVRTIGIYGKGFKLSDGNAIYEPGGIGRLRKTYGKRLKRVRLDHGERLYRITGRYKGRAVSTEFPVDKFGADAQIGTIFMGFR
jgi:hypothetical protein